MALVVPLWKSLQEEQNEIKLKVSTLIREKEREIAAVRRKVEWEMNGRDNYLSTIACCSELLNHFLVSVINICLFRKNRGIPRQRVGRSEKIRSESFSYYRKIGA